MKRLAGVPELLDGELDEDTLRSNLRDLSRVNRWLGGAALSIRAINSIEPRPSGVTRILDIGTGAGDIPLALVRWARRSGRALEVTATDVRPEIVALARESVGLDGVSVALAGPDAIDQPDASFDVVHCSMVVHHLEPHAAMALLTEMARVARRAVVVNDLDRARRWLWGAVAMSRLFTGNSYTRNDGPLSVRRAYRPDELLSLASQAGLTRERLLWAWPHYRYALVLRPAHQDAAPGD